MSARLSTEQIECLRLLATGTTRAEIAEQLGSTEDAVGAESEQIQQVLDVQSPGQAIIVAMRKGLFVACTGVAIPFSLFAHHIPQLIT